MVTNHKTIEVEPDSELAHALEEANWASLVLIKDGMRYRLLPEGPTSEATDANPSATYDPARAHAGIEAAAGSWSDLDTEQMILDIYRWREEGSRPPDRP